MTPLTTSPPDAAAWNTHSGVTLLHTIATAVIQLADDDGLESFTLPYPPEAQRALDRTVLRCLLRGAEPPRSLPDLLAWCRDRPVADWPLQLPDDAVAPDHYLIDTHSGRPTELCHEWALNARDSAVRDHVRQVIHSAMQLCRQANAPESYTAFRRLLVEQPVLTEHGLFRAATDLFLEPVRDLVDQIYEPVPDSYLRGGHYMPCHRCLTLLTPLAGNGWWCERDHCRRQGLPVPAAALAVQESGPVYQLDRPLRQFVTGPGRAELDLEARVRQLGLPVEMWPGYDAYDLRITFPDDHVWAIDVKDWANPALLGREAAPVRPDPPYHEAFWVVPRHRVDARPGYLRAYVRNRPAAAKNLPLVTDDQLLHDARRRLHGLAPQTGHIENGTSDA